VSRRSAKHRHLRFPTAKALTRLLNRTDFLRIFVLDCALGQADSRQAIFARDRQRGGFRAYLIDHGTMFGGREWVIRDLPRVAVYFDLAAYSVTNIADIYVDAIRRVEGNIREEDLYSAIAELPADWFAAEDYRALDGLFKQIQRRRRNLEEILSGHWEELRLSVDFERDAALNELPQLAPNVC